MNLPNALTMVRFVLIPVYLTVFFAGHEKIAFGILLLAGVTDVLDGYLARRNNLITELGMMLDPLADKLMLVAVIFSLLFTGQIPWLAAAALVIRDGGMIAGSAIFHFRGKKTVPANTMGKLTTVLLYVAILFIIYDVRFALPYLWCVILFSFITSFIYILKINLLNREENKSKDQTV